MQPVAHEDTAGRPTRHVAFATDDIIAVADHLHSRGVDRLKISVNYYDDQEASYPLPTRRLEEELRRLGLLYDRSGGGEYFELFTHPRQRVVRDRAADGWLRRVRRRQCAVPVGPAPHAAGAVCGTG